MKRLIIFSFLGLFLFSCGKYEDGPAFSVFTKTNRLARKWKLSEAQVDGQTSTTITTWDLDFDADGNFIESYDDFIGTYPSGSFTGTWEFANSKEDIALTFDNGEERELEIRRLTREEFWFDFLRESDGVIQRVEVKLEAE